MLYVLLLLLLRVTASTFAQPLLKLGLAKLPVSWWTYIGVTVVLLIIVFSLYSVICWIFRCQLVNALVICFSTWVVSSYALNWRMWDLPFECSFWVSSIPLVYCLLNAFLFFAVMRSCICFCMLVCLAICKEDYSSLFSYFVDEILTVVYCGVRNG